MCSAEAGEHNAVPMRPRFRFLQGSLEKGRLEQECGVEVMCRCICLAQIEEREGKEAAAGSVMLRVMRGLRGCAGSD